MGLPNIGVNTFRLTIPSLEEEKSFRPFLVKEEKILLMALEGDQEEDMVNAVRQIVQNCCLSDIDVEKLTVFDLEYIFLQLRANSVGETVELKFNVKKEIDGEVKTDTVTVPVNLMDIKVVVPEGHTRKIELSDQVGVLMKYPDLEFVDGISDLKNVDEVYDVVIKCIETIYDAESVYDPKEYTREELVAFLENLTHSQFGKIEQFFKTLPRVRHTVKIVSKKLDYEEEVKLEGIRSFFG